MRKIFNFLIVSLILLSTISVMAQSYITEDMKKDTMPTSQIKRGMKGYGLTVFQGTKIEKFNIEVLGVIKSANSGGDLIYVKLSHPVINRTNSGVIQGMSGSPCYINGKLIGAVAYGNSFSKENVCMLTPIRDMFETWDPNLNKDKGMAKTVKIPNSNATFSLMNIPLSISGLSKTTQDMFSDNIKELGFTPVQGGTSMSANMPDAKNATLNPGASLGVVLVSGDIILTGTGTVTYKKGNKILGFGHPMMNIGSTNMPMCKAYIVDIFSSYMVSNKVSNPLGIVGNVFQDRPFAIAGSIGETANMTPVNVKVIDKSTGRENNLKCKVVSQPYFFNQLAAAPIVEGLTRTRSQITQTYAEVTYNLELVDNKKYTFTNYYTSETSITDQVSNQVQIMLGKLNNSKYGVQKVKSINVTATLYDGNKFAYIERVFLNKNTFKPGETIKLGLVMRKYANKDTYTEYKDITLPNNMEEGKIAILVYGGILSDMMKINVQEKSNSTVLPVSGETDNTTSFEQYFNKYLTFDRNNELVVKVIPENGAVLVANGEKLIDLPPYMKLLFSNTNNSVITTEPLEYKTVFKSNNIPMGAATIVVPIESDVKVNVYDNNLKPLINVYNYGETLEEVKLNFKNNQIKLMAELDEALDATAKDVKDKAIPSTFKAENKEDKKVDNTTGNKTDNTTDKDTKKESKKKIKKITKQALKLEFKDPDDFKKGTFTNCNIGNSQILPTMEITKNIPVKEQLVTAGLNSSIGTIVGTGLKSGIGLLRNNKISKISGLNGLWVSSIVETPDHNIYVATNPKSTIYKISKTPLGLTADIVDFKTNNKYISDMIVTKEGNILIGFSDSDEIIMVNSNFEVINKINHGGVYTTTFSKNNNGDIIAGTKNKVISVDNKLNISTLINDMGGSINCVSITDAGEIFAFVADKNFIIKKDNGGINKIVAKSPEMFKSFVDKKGNAYFVGKDNMLKILKNGNYVVDKCTDYAAQFSSIIPVDDDNVLLTSTNPGSIFLVDLNPNECIYSTNVIDFGEDIKLDSITVPANNCEITVGKTLVDAKPVKDVNTLKDFRVFVKFNDKIEGSFNKLTINYFMPNRAPKVRISNLNTNDILTDKKSIEWDVLDPDKDSYTIELYAKPANGTWSLIYPNDKEKPEIDKDPIKSYELDTTTLKDGIYDFKVVANDIVSNPEDNKTDEDIVTSVRINNAQPEIKTDKTAYEVGINEVLNIKGIAKENGLQIVGIQYSLNGASWLTALTNDTTDGKELTISTKFDKAGDNKILLRAIDQIENYTDLEINIKVK